MRPQLNPLILGPGAPWSLPGSSLDIQFTTGRAAVNRQKASISSLLTTTRASTGYASTSTGSLVLFPTNTPRITDLGLLVEEARTNVVLWNRDLTNAAWTKSNITAALTQTGADGTANAATSLTATAGNGTCLQAITLASSARFQSAYVKRLTGSGVINMTMDNGATWTAITVTAAYTQLTIPTQTLANPTVGFRIVTSGDAIAVDFVENETGTVATSPIATTTVAVTRAADVITLKSVAPFGPAGTMFVSSSAMSGLSQFWGLSLFDSGSKNLALRHQSDNKVALRANDGSDRSINEAATITTGVVKAVGAYATNDLAMTYNGLAVVTGATFTPFTVATAYLGTFSGTTDFANSYITRVAYWPTRLSNTQLQALST